MGTLRKAGLESLPDLRLVYHFWPSEAMVIVMDFPNNLYFTVGYKFVLKFSQEWSLIIAKDRKKGRP
ncbi:MAG: hypothetical protein IBX72_10055 [Nitrospirae bacterium]|jgi:hypothetical protein|nr:hypothetical protein [Nitrospirota bacterium]